MICVIPHKKMKFKLPFRGTCKIHFQHKRINEARDKDDAHGVLFQNISSVAFILQANYAGWATATGRRILVPTFADRGVSRGQRGGSLTVVNLGFLDRSRYFLYQVARHFSSRGRKDPVPDPLLLRKYGSARNRTWDLCVCSHELWLNS
jgi:hypothetical protein